MHTVASRVAHNLRRPLPELVAWIYSKILSILWRGRLQSVGNGFHVGRGALIEGGQYIKIGTQFNAREFLWIAAVNKYREFCYEPVIEIGDNVLCSQNVHIAATNRVIIGDGVLFGSRIHVTDHSHGVYDGEFQDSPNIPPALRAISRGRPVVIERNVWLGDGVVVLPGVTIGEGCIIGANSVVSRSLPPWVVAVGAPAIPIKRFDSVSQLWISI